MLLTVDRHREIEARTGTFLRVIVWDEAGAREVTSRCVAADDRHGWALCYVVDDEGRKQFDPKRRQMAMEILTGHVMFDRAMGR